MILETLFNNEELILANRLGLELLRLNTYSDVY